MEITGARVETSSPFEIEKHIEKLILIVNSPTENLTRKLAISHDMFEQIHPFPDGNGRVGRILMNFILVAHGLPNLAIKGSEADKKLYVDALEEADPLVQKILKNGKIEESFLHPLVQLEDLINKSLAVALDIIICSRFSENKKLMSLNEVAVAVGRDISSFRVACSQKNISAQKSIDHLKATPNYWPSHPSNLPRVTL